MVFILFGYHSNEIDHYPYLRHGCCACLQWKPFANAVITNLNFGEWWFGVHETRSLPCINRTDSRLMPRASNWHGSILHGGINGSFPEVWNTIDKSKRDVSSQMFFHKFTNRSRYKVFWGFEIFGIEFVWSRRHWPRDHKLLVTNWRFVASTKSPDSLWQNLNIDVWTKVVYSHRKIPVYILVFSFYIMLEMNCQIELLWTAAEWYIQFTHLMKPITRKSVISFLYSV